MPKLVPAESQNPVSIDVLNTRYCGMSYSPIVGQIERQFKLRSGPSGRVHHWFVSCRHVCRSEVGAQARAGGRQAIPIYEHRCPPAMGSVGPVMVIEVDPSTDLGLGVAPAREGVQARCRRGATSVCTWWATSRVSTASVGWSGGARIPSRCGKPFGWKEAHFQRAVKHHSPSPSR